MPIWYSLKSRRLNALTYDWMVSTYLSPLALEMYPMFVKCCCVKCFGFFLLVVFELCRLKLANSMFDVSAKYFHWSVCKWQSTFFRYIRYKFQFDRSYWFFHWVYLTLTTFNKTCIYNLFENVAFVCAALISVRCTLYFICFRKFFSFFKYFFSLVRFVVFFSVFDVSTSIRFSNRIYLFKIHTNCSFDCLQKHFSLILKWSYRTQSS